MTVLTGNHSGALKRDAASVSGWERGMEPPSKRRVTEQDQKIRQVATIVRVADFEDASKNAIWMNKRDICTLFGLQEQQLDLGKESKFVQVANQVYKVVMSPWVQRGMVGLNPIQIEDCGSGIFSFQNTQGVLLSSFDEGCLPSRSLSEAVLSLEPYQDFLCEREDTCILHVQDLRRSLIEEFEGHYFRKGQSLLLHHPKGAFRLRFKDATCEDLSMSMFGGDLKNQNFLITEQTVFDFVVEKSERILLLDQVINEDVESARFRITSATEKPGLMRRGGSSPLVREASQVKEEVRQAFLGSEMIFGHTCSIDLDGWELSVSFEGVNYKEEQAMSTSVKSAYEKLFTLDERMPIDLDSCSQLILTKDRDSAIPAEELHFEIVKVDGKRRLDKKIWMSAFVLEELVKEQARVLAKGEHLLVPSNEGNFVLALQSGINTSILEEEESYENLWEMGMATDVKFQVSGDAGVFLVDTEEAQEAKKIQVTVDLRPSLKSFLSKGLEEDSEEESVTLSEGEVKKLLDQALPEKFVEGQVFYVKTEGGERIKLTVSYVGLKEEEIQYSEYGFLVKKSEETEVELLVGSSKNLVIQNEPKTSKVVTPQEAMQELELGGLSEQFKQIIRTIILSRGPMKQEAARRGIRPVKGLLLYGPPGTGKTTLARKIGRVLGCSEDRIKVIAGPEVWNKWVGESEKNIRNLFSPARQAAERFGEKSPLHLIIIDEIDAILSRRGDNEGAKHRDSVVDQFLGELDGLKQLDNVLVVGMTNHIEMLDPAIIRSGRFDVKLELTLPKSKARKEIFDIHMRRLKDQGLVADDVKMPALVDKTEGWSGADIEGLIRKAVFHSFERLNNLNLSPEEARSNEAGKVCMDDFEKAIPEIKAKDQKEDPPPSFMYL